MGEKGSDGRDPAQRRDGGTADAVASPRRRPRRERRDDSPIRWLRRGLSSVFNVRAGRASYATIRKRFVNGSRLDGTHICILIVAMLIACIGLNTNSTECIVGAMLICPLMGSVLAISYSVATADLRLLRNAVVGLLVQVVFCLATSTLYFVLTPVNAITDELLSNSSPTVWDLLVALAGGFAGGLGNSRKQEPATLIAGVAVATALMPPLCAAGYGIATRDAMWFLSAFYEFSLNVVFIALAAELVLLALKVPLHRDINEDGVITLNEEQAAERLSKRIKRFIVIATTVFVIPCIFVTADVVRESAEPSGDSSYESTDQYEASLTTKEIRAICPELEEYRIGTEYVSDPTSGTTKEVVVATVKTSSELSSAKKSEIRALIMVHVEVD